MKYLINRTRKIFGDKEVSKFSPWGRVTLKKGRINKYGMDGADTYDIMGVTQLDYYDLFRKFTYNTSSLVLL